MNAALSGATIFLFPTLAGKSSIGETVLKVLRHSPSIVEGMLFQKSLELRPERQMRSPGAWNVSAAYITISKLLELYFYLSQPVDISAECGDKSPMDFLRRNLSSSNI
jgi:hypothetical protein